MGCCQSDSLEGIVRKADVEKALDASRKKGSAEAELVKLKIRFAKTAFEVLDANGNEKLSLEELQEYFGYDDSELLMSLIDTNSDTELSQTEFTAWTNTYVTKYLEDKKLDSMIKIMRCGLVSRKHDDPAFVDALFDELDLDSNGYIDPTELTSVFGKDSTDFVKELDTISQDGKISPQEFKNWAHGSGSEGSYQLTSVVLEKALNGVLHLFTAAARKLSD